MVYLIFLLGSFCANSKEPNKIPAQCKINCSTPYGVVLGESPAGIPAYSNCNSSCVVFEPNYKSKIYTGIQWQCVEYARRWLLTQKQVVYGDVDIAADIWGMPTVENPNSKKNYEFKSLVNGSESLPRKGDLIIYSKEYLGTGHVAVVVNVEEQQNVIQVAEQNYENKHWGHSYSREISFVNQNKQYWLLDSYLIGWKRVIKDE